MSFFVYVFRAATLLQAVNSNGSGDIRLGISADDLALHPVEKTVLQNNELVTFRPF